jgi:UDPglucose 6-dehydrogenase
MKVGLIGCGVIGGAFKAVATERGFDIKAYDKFLSGYKNPDVIFDTTIVFLCVPTPTPLDSAEQDLSAVIENIEMLAAKKYQGAVVIRSTVVPGTTDALQKKYPDLKLVHNPEFLTAARPKEDLIEQKVVMLGSHDDMAMTYAEKFWRMFDQKVPILLAPNPTITELAKYMHNVMLSIKVSSSNEFYEICQKIGMPYDKVREFAVAAGGIGAGHTKVPGPDGSLGFGGMCFTKDTMALLAFARTLGLKAEMVDAAITQNKRIRPQEYEKKSS